jgi:hypothetical protein
MSRLLHVCAAAIGLTLSPLAGQAQRGPAASGAFGIGWSPAAGLIGVEFVNRSFRRLPRLGGAAGIGLAGAGVRLNLSLRNPVGARPLPYLGVGYVATPWLPVLRMSGAVCVEGGLQVWPLRRDGVYVDLGTGVAVPAGASRTIGPVLRLLVGHTL